MHSSFIAVFLAVLAPMAVLASPRWHSGSPFPTEWHHEPSGLRPSATASIAAGILPTGAGSAWPTGTPTKLYEWKKSEGASGVAGAASTETPKRVAAPTASASVSLIAYN